MKKFALAGNPNCGKTTLFNSLTGSTAHVGNWPGVTVDKREGKYKKLSEPIDIVDLPGIYSLSPYTPEEVISRNFILDEKPDCIINIIDATNLERNLYLTTQLMEIDVPMVIALNMMDLVEKNGDKIDAKELEKRIGLPVIKVSALKETGLEDLMKKAYEASLKPRVGTTVLKDSALGHLIQDVSIAFKGKEVPNPLFHAVKLVEMDSLEVKDHKDLVEMVNEFKSTFKDDVFNGDFEALVADDRYKYITKNFSSVLKRHEVDKKKKVGDHRLTLSDRIDRVLTNKWAGIPIFIIILIVIFHLVFSEDFLGLGLMGAFGEEGIVSFPEIADPTNLGQMVYNNFSGLFANGAINSPGVILANLLNAITGSISTCISYGMEQAGAEAWAQGLVCDGILGGLFAVLGFLPQILLLFLFFSILEDSGYMARIAFILDRIFRRFGLSGRAFMPMIMGFGCSVPAMINTRTLASDNERTATIRVIPFFSCGAKLPILTAVAGAICTAVGFPYVDLITVSMYVLGIVVAICAVLFMRGTTMRGEVPPFIMELPAYHWPQFKSLMIHLWDKAKHFVKKAFTIILLSTILIWFFSHFSWDWHYLEDAQMEESILAGVGKLITPIFTPLGFGSQLQAFSWVFAVAAITGLIAKENVIATFATLAAAITASYVADGDATGVGAVGVMIQATGIEWPGLIAFIAFNMLTIPCFAATATARAEVKKGTFKWTVLFWLACSYLVSMMLYLVFTWWWTVFIFAVIIAAAIIFIHYFNKYRDAKKLIAK